MKTPNALGYLASTLLLLPVSFLAATSDNSPVVSGADSQKTHTLYMGTDISVEVGSKLYRIADVDGAFFVVTVDGRKTKVPMRGEPHNLKVVPSLKLADTSASVTGFSCERAYTPRSDPEMRRQLSANEASAAIGDNASLADGQWVKAMNNGNVWEQPPAYTSVAPVTGAQEANYMTTVVQPRDAAAAQVYQVAQDMATAEQSSEVAGGAYGELQAQVDLQKEQFDAVEVNFTVSSMVPLEKPFLFLIVNYREEGSKAASTRKLIYAKALDSIGTHSEKIHFMQGGLPPGFVLESYQLHLYDSGKEIASDVAPKRVALTSEDAFQYVMADYLSTHKKATAPAAPAMGKPDGKVVAALTFPQLVGVYYVKVSKDGLPLEAYTDQVCTIPVDPQIGSVVKNVRFYPALVDGRPVEGIARLVLNQLPI